MIKKDVWKISGGIFDLAYKQERITEIEKKEGAPGFWDDPLTAQELLREKAGAQRVISSYEGLVREMEEIEILLEIAAVDDGGEAKEAEQRLGETEGRLKALELARMFTEKDDPRNVFVSINAGAGGTEAQDWTEILLRMYLRWAERRGFSAEIVDILAGEEAGIKNVTFLVKGDYAYGNLKAEIGIHRLVRISPFDAGKRRHTSFASVFVYPEIEDKIQVEIKDEELRVDTYRASGAGGQHVNKVSSAVRITHLPSGIVVQCQNERSQHKNREMAMKILRSKLYQLKKEEEEKKLQKIESQKKKIEWGSQIRSYVFHPYNLVKDHRTGVETSNTQAVMDGDLDQFINAFLSRKD